MKNKEILVFGASGQVGRHLIRKFTKNNYKVIAVTRNIHQKGYILKTQANPGYLELRELKTFDEKKIREMMENCEACINLIGILYEKKKGHFDLIHSKFPELISKIASEKKINQLVHLSSLGIDKVENSIYALSKKKGENKIKENFDNAVLLKPSIVFSQDDKFTTKFMSLLSKLPIMPLYYNGSTKFMPIHVSDLVNIIFEIIDKNLKNMTLECVGSEIFSFKQIIEILLKSIEKKRILLPMPLPLAKLSAKFFQIFPNPLLTEDQLKLLYYDNIPTGIFKTNNDIGIPSRKKFEAEVNKYSYNWKIGGQFSKKKLVNYE